MTIYFFLPAGFANMAPVLVQRWVPWLAIPLDGGMTFHGKRLLGDHKTLRGLVCGIALALAIAYLQSLHPFPSLEVVNYEQWVLLGFLQGGGALVGDLIKSFFKRRIGIAPGQSWRPFDQIDFILGAIAATAIAFPIPLDIMTTALVLGFFLHVLTNHLGYWLHLRKMPW